MKSFLKPIYSFYLVIAFSCTVADNQNCNNENLINYAAQGDQNKIDACFKSGAQILVSSHGKSIKEIALENDHLALATYFVTVQTNQFLKRNSPLDTTTLWEAIEYDNTEIVQHFIANNININPKFRDGLTPIVYAIFNESNETLKVLLNEGVDVGYEFDSRPLICISAMFNQLEATEILLNYGANVNDLDGSGVTPLMFAAREGNTKMVKFLLAKGADKSLQEIRNETAADMVKDNEELKNLLEE